LWQKDSGLFDEIPPGLRSGFVLDTIAGSKELFDGPNKFFTTIVIQTAFYLRLSPQMD